MANDRKWVGILPQAAIENLLLVDSIPIALLVARMGPFLAEQSNQAPYTSPHAHVGQGPQGPIAQDPQQALYHALQGKAVMALVLDVHGVGRWMACRFYFPAASPNLQGHFEDTVIFANNIAVPVDRSKVAPGQTH